LAAFAPGNPLRPPALELGITFLFVTHRENANKNKSVNKEMFFDSIKVLENDHPVNIASKIYDLGCMERRISKIKD
jgi:hypothetical protein